MAHLISSRVTTFSSDILPGSPRLAILESKVELLVGLAFSTGRSRSPMTCWITLKVVRASLARLFDKTNNGEEMGCFCHSMIRARGTRDRNIPDRLVAKYLEAKSSARKFWISELIEVGNKGCRPVLMRFVRTVFSTKMGDVGSVTGNTGAVTVPLS